MKVGYARVSTQDQNLDLQTDALKKAGCEKIFTDKVSGVKFHRQGLNQALDFLRQGDTLVVWKLDRLGRSTAELIKISASLQERKIELQSITESIDTSSPTGRLFFTILGAIAQMEREIIQERIKAGLKAANKRGRKNGRPRVMTKDKKETAIRLLKEGRGYNEVAGIIGVSRSVLYSELPAKVMDSMMDDGDL